MKDVKAAQRAYDDVVDLDVKRKRLLDKAEKAVKRAKATYKKSPTRINRAKLSDAYSHRKHRRGLHETSHKLRKQRLAELNAAKSWARQPLRVRALAEARSMLGTLEEGGNNRGTVVDKIIKSNGGDLGEAWCGDAVAYWYRNAGSTVVTRAWAAAHAGIWGWFTGVVRLRSLKNLKAGQIVEYNWQHTGLFEKWIDKSAGTFYAIEGNTGAQGNTSDTTADGIRRRTRNINDVAGAFSPQR